MYRLRKPSRSTTYASEQAAAILASTAVRVNVRSQKKHTNALLRRQIGPSCSASRGPSRRADTLAERHKTVNDARQIKRDIGLQKGLD